MSESKATSSQGHYINGKGQIVDMLKMMNPDEKKTLLKNIRLRNPSLALELSEKSFLFKNIEHFSDESLQILINYLQAPILGLAIKTSTVKLQRRVLALAHREYAEEAFKVLQTPLQNEMNAINRAQDRVISTIMTLFRRGQMELS